MSKSKNKICPYCNGREVLTGFNDVETVTPEKLILWDYEKNLKPPSIVKANSKERVWWKCPECFYEWMQEPINLKDCGVCANRILKLGVNYIWEDEIVTGAFKEKVLESLLGPDY